MHFKNARAVLSIDAWCYLRNRCVRLAGGQCEVCGSTDKGKLECHEPWEFESLRLAGNEKHVMRLVGLRVLCRLCHCGKHLGFAKRNAAKYEEVKKHVLRVHGITEEEFAQIERNAVEEVIERDKCGTRELDLTYLNDSRFEWVRQRARRTSFSTNELANCRPPSSNEDLAA